MPCMHMPLRNIQTGAVGARLTRIGRIATPPLSVFFSFLSDGNGYGRTRYDSRTSEPVRLNEAMTAVTRVSDSATLDCEDPRCFKHGGKTFVADNRWLPLEGEWGSRNRLYCVEEKRYIPLGLDGKNFTYVSHSGNLYLIYRFAPLQLYTVDLLAGKCDRVPTDPIYSEDWEYRGGTPGYPTEKPGVYRGFGHRTYLRDDELIHDLFAWEVTLEDKISVDITSVVATPPPLKISDPTCILKDKYLVTAESELPWFTDQEYVTNLYEIEWPPL